MKYTKGEWKLSYNPGWSLEFDISFIDINADNKESIASVWHDNRESVANAKLIASAPDLLEALINLKDEVSKSCSIGSDPQLQDLMSKYHDADRAIKKATE